MGLVGLEGRVGRVGLAGLAERPVRAQPLSSAVILTHVFVRLTVKRARAGAVAGAMQATPRHAGPRSESRVGTNLRRARPNAAGQCLTPTAAHCTALGHSLGSRPATWYVACVTLLGFGFTLPMQPQHPSMPSSRLQDRHIRHVKNIDCSSRCDARQRCELDPLAPTPPPCSRSAPN